MAENHEETNSDAEEQAGDKQDDESNLGVEEEETTQSNSAMKTPKNDNSATQNTMDDDDDEEEMEGAGFNLVHEQDTPESVRQERILQEQHRKQKKKTNLASRRSIESDEILSDPETTTPAKSTKSKKKKKVRISTSPMGYPAAPREYAVVPVSDLKASPKETGVRRSRRAHYPPLKFWKNERPVYGANDEGGALGEAMGDMPVVKEIVHALPTPHKKRVVPEKTKKSNAKARGKKGAEDDDEKPFDARKLKRKYDYLKGEHALVWNNGLDDVKKEKVISYSRNLERHDLPLGKGRKKSDGNVVGRAAQAFNVANDPNDDDQVGYIMGHLALPPKGIKDHESVGRCAQTFTVCHGQPNALEVSFADHEESEGQYDPDTAQRFLVGPGDMFRVPPNNCYQLQNHSTTHECLLTWTIIKPRDP